LWLKRVIPLKTVEPAFVRGLSAGFHGGHKIVKTNRKKQCNLRPTTSLQVAKNKLQLTSNELKVGGSYVF
jgi:hypothetical protein